VNLKLELNSSGMQMRKKIFGKSSKVGGGGRSWLVKCWFEKTGYSRCIKQIVLRKYCSIF